jgi:membrane-associated PAP2 superfamily phosphatase
MNKQLKKITVYIVVLALLTVVFRVFNLDIAVQKLFFDFPRNAWKYADNAFVIWLYKYGTYPAIILAAAAVVVFTMGFVYEGMKKHRKAALLIILTMFIGPGLVTNVILKNYAGRPRPRDVKEFNGGMDFKQPFEPGNPGRGFSFPCGHCTMGFFFYAVYLILRKKNKRASYAVLSGSVLYGTAMGIGRMAQGGHFASDVFWAAGITVLTAETLHTFVIKTDETGSILDHIKVKNKALAYIASLLLLAVTAFVFLNATPFNRHRKYAIGYYPGAEIIGSRADITVGDRPNKDGSIEFKAAGFAPPWSDYEDFINTDGTLIYMATARGAFSELNAGINVVFAAGRERSVTITAGEGNIDYYSDAQCGSIYLNSGKGNIEFKPLYAHEIKNIVINAANGDVILKLAKTMRFFADAKIDIKAPGGSVLIQNSSIYFQDMNKSASKLSGSKELQFKTLVKGGPQLNASAKTINIEAVK